MSLTLRELDLYAEGKNKRDRELYRQSVQVAHMSAKLNKMRKIPPLNQILPPEQTTLPTKQELAVKTRDFITRNARKGEVTFGKGKKKRKQ